MNCNKEYNGKDNFKWSCRVHQSDYSGEVWWCCGKSDKNAPGCKVNMHQEKADEEIEELEGETINRMNKRCLCCREFGHTADSCPKDPNLKTLENADIENLRIKQIHDNRKIFADTIVTTAQFLKTCAKVPKIVTLDDDSQKGLDDEEADRLKE